MTTNSVSDTWQSSKLGGIAQVKGGKRLPKGEKLVSEATQFPYIRVCDFKGFSVDMKDIHYLTSKIQETISRYVITKDDVFISIAVTIGRVGTIPVELDGANLTENAARIVLDQEGVLEKEFLKYCLASPKIQRDIASRRSKNAQPKLALAQIKDLDIPLPPLPEQKKIAHVLSTVQRAIEAQERIIQTTTELKKALMQKLFTEGLRNEPQKQTEIGPVPESWKVMELGTLLREPLRNGHSAKATKDENGIRTLTLTAVTQRDFSVQNTKVTCADPHRVKDMWLKPGDIFVERANTADYVGLAALYEGEEDFAIFPDLLIRVRVDKTRIPKVLTEWLLAEPCRRYYKKNARLTAGNFPKIDQGTVEKTLVPVPPPNKQAELEVAFRALDKKINQHSRSRIALQDLFRTLLHKLMTARIRVHDIDLPN